MSSKLDFAQRITQALNDTSKAEQEKHQEYNPADHNIIGIVPIHLRHLYNLIQEFHDELIAVSKEIAENLSADNVNNIEIPSYCILLTNQVNCTEVIFYTSFLQHTGIDFKLGNHLIVCGDWKVATLRNFTSNIIIEEKSALDILDDFPGEGSITKH